MTGLYCLRHFVTGAVDLFVPAGREGIFADPVPVPGSARLHSRSSEATIPYVRKLSESGKLLSGCLLSGIPGQAAIVMRC